MLASIIRGALRYPVTVVALAAILVAYGSATLVGAKYDVFPEFIPAQADIQVEAPGLSPEDVERLVTQPLENAILGGANIAAVRSESIQGLASINVVFDDASDVYRDRQLLAERVAEATPSLPVGVKAPILGPMISSTMDLLKIGFTSDTMSGMDLRTLIDWTVRPRMLAVPGVSRAIVYGGGRREIQIQVRPERLSALGLSLNDVLTAASGATGVRGAGFVETENQRVLLENVGTARTPEQIGAVVISQREGNNVLLRDVGSVRYAPQPPFGDASVQGRADVLLSISSQFGANTLEATRLVEEKLAQLMPMLKAKGVNVYPALHRPANFVEVALRNTRDSLLLGAVLVLLVLLAFLRNWRTALISFFTIPVSLLIAVIVIQRIGWTINTMTLGGLAVAVGVVVDDGIIDVENIMRRLRLARASRLLTPIEAIILNASIEVRRPIVLATLVVGLAFCPMLLLPGLQGSFFAPLGLAFLLATFASLLVALTVTPAFSLLLLRRTKPTREPRWIRRLKIAHHDVLRRTARHGPTMLLLSLLLGAGAVLVAMRFGGELIPPFREGHFVVQVVAPPGTSLSETIRVGDRVSRKMLQIPGVSTVSQQVGRAESGEDTWGPNRSEFHVELRPGLGSSDQMRVEQALRRTFKEVPAIQSDVVTFLGDRISESFSGASAAVTVSVFGADLAQLDQTAKEIARIVGALPGAQDVQLDLETGVPVVRIRPVAARLAAFGVRPVDLFEAVAAAYQGAVVAQVYDGNQPLAVRVVLDPTARQDPEAVGALLIKTAAGRQVPLSVLAEVALDSGRARVLHESGLRRQVIMLNPATRDVVGFVATAKRAVAANLKLPAGVFLEFGGTAEGARAAAEDLTVHSLVAALGVVLLLMFAFADWRSVGLILVNVPFALIGGVIAVALTGGNVSIGALVGFVTLFGISGRNTIMLVSHYEHLVRVEGRPWTAITAVRGARERLTPILMTASVTALGLLPLAIGNGEAGREVEGPMAVVILGGLVSSTLLNLFVMPALAARYLSPRAIAATERAAELAS